MKSNIWSIAMDNLPLWWASLATVALFVLLAIGTWTVSRESILQDAPDKARWRDIRIWASVLIVIQLCIYLVFS